MALRCQVVLSSTAYSAGQTPPPSASLIVYNPNAAAVTVTGVQMKARTFTGTVYNRVAMAQLSPPIGPGMTVTAPALSAITMGLFPVVVASAANSNQFQQVVPSGNVFPQNPQPSQPQQVLVLVGAEVTATDGSLNEAVESGMLVSYTSPPPVGYQGGFLQFNGPNNAALGFVVGVL